MFFSPRTQRHVAPQVTRRSPRRLLSADLRHTVLTVSGCRHSRSQRPCWLWRDIIAVFPKRFQKQSWCIPSCLALVFDVWVWLLLQRSTIQTAVRSQIVTIIAMPEWCWIGFKMPWLLLQCEGSIYKYFAVLGSESCHLLFIALFAALCTLSGHCGPVKCQTPVTALAFQAPQHPFNCSLQVKTSSFPYVHLGCRCSVGG